MDIQNNADRRAALSRAMRGSSGMGERRRGGGRKTAGKRGMVCLLLAVLLCGGLVFWSHTGQKASFYVSVGDRSKEDQGGEEQSTEKKAGTDEKADQSGQTPVPYEVPETVRVLLMNRDFSNIYHDQLVLAGDTAEVAVTADGLRGNFEEWKEQFLQEGLILEQEGERYVLMPQEEERLQILSLSRACGTPSYRGKLYLYVRDDRLVLVNELSLEEYLYSVLPSEMPASYHEEALKAQAVCARTYACAVMENPRYPEFDAQLDDSTSCQVYGNLAEHENTTAAVEQTRGEILLYQERPVSTYYYSTSCGIGSDISVWQGFPVEEYPYLTNRSFNAAHEELNLADDTEFAAYLAAEHEDTERAYPWYRWSCQVSGVNADQMYEKIKERYLVKPESVELVGAGIQTEAESGGQAESSGGQAESSGGQTEEERLPHPGRIVGLSVAERSTSGCATCLLIEGEEHSYRIYGEYNVRYLLCDGETTVTRQDGSTTVMRTILPSAYLILTPLLDKEEFIGYSIIGGGYGHGVGMSQNGADMLAASGTGYRDILAYYYVGTELKIPK
ncbi:MAG: SpoIID/LytB domain-containing protein [Clostridium sp.]|nr:SpoIID/LytB domain-containing protein [Clostridium sp.]